MAADKGRGAHQYGDGFGATLRAIPKLPHCCCEDRNFSFAENQETPRNVFPQEFPHLDGTNFLEICFLLVICDTRFRDVCNDFLCFRQRSNPLIAIKYVCRGVLFLLQEHELCVEEESTVFWEVP